MNVLRRRRIQEGNREDVPRRLNPIYIDPYDGVVLAERFDPKWDPVRRGMGYTLAFANRLDLAKCLPNNRLASTEYCLANPGQEYLVRRVWVPLPIGALVRWTEIRPLR